VLVCSAGKGNEESQSRVVMLPDGEREHCVGTLGSFLLPSLVPVHPRMPVSPGYTSIYCCYCCLPVRATSRASKTVMYRGLSKLAFFVTC